MLSRFDLIFLLLDRPDADRDKRLTEHVLAMHSGVASRAAAARSGLLEYSTAGGAGGPASLLLTDGSSGGRHGGRQPLLERLRARQPDDDPLPQQLLRKYIAYARQYVHPRLTRESQLRRGGMYGACPAGKFCRTGQQPHTAQRLMHSTLDLTYTATSSPASAFLSPFPVFSCTQLLLPPARSSTCPSPSLPAADAIAVLKAYYLQLRAASAADPGALPVTARQLESLVRLSEARARVELREEVTREDAEVGAHTARHIMGIFWSWQLAGQGGRRWRLQTAFVLFTSGCF